MNTVFFGTASTYLITVEFSEGKGNARFVFADEREYRNKRAELSGLDNIESIYCVTTEITTIFEERGAELK